MARDDLIFRPPRVTAREAIEAYNRIKAGQATQTDRSRVASYAWHVAYKYAALSWHKQEADAEDCAQETSFRVTQAVERCACTL